MHEALDYVRGVSQMLMKKVEILEGHFKLRRSAGVSAPLNFVNNWPHHSRHCPHFISPSALASLPVYNFRVSTHLSASNYSFPPPTFKPFTVSHIFVRDIEWIVGLPCFVLIFVLILTLKPSFYNIVKWSYWLNLVPMRLSEMTFLAWDHVGALLREGLRCNRGSPHRAVYQTCAKFWQSRQSRVLQDRV